MTDILFPPFLTIALTGTPGTGKTEVSKKLESEGYRILHITEFIKEYSIPSERDDERDCDVVDMDALEEAVFEYQQKIRKEFNQTYYSNNLTLGDVHKSPEFLPVLIVESHLAHYLCDLSVVLRTHPNTLKDRLGSRGYSDRKVMENVMAESIDVVLCDCFDYCRRVYEINTTEMSLDETASCLKELIHALYDDELKTYENLMSKMNAFAEDIAAQQALAAGLPISDVLCAYSDTDDGAVIYEGNDEVGDYDEEKHPILIKYVPGKNDWSELVD
ncbi:adenylate kinase family protein [Methanimicrococcus sp. OttesenSCG-928-J09]|nr:adenylate kinase family protein [Methanimicrococcus sp. OttesenSCG-928-J09]